MFRRGVVCAERFGLKRGIEEFFDGSANANPGERRTGRSWKPAELRLKSFDDLHKLWYVLLKEKNMLLSEKQLARSQSSTLPNPERLWKVKKSMARLKTIVNERSREYKNMRALEQELKEKALD